MPGLGIEGPFRRCYAGLFSRGRTSIRAMYLSRTLSQTEETVPRTSNGKRRSEVEPAVGIIGLSLSMAGPAPAAATGPVTDGPSQATTARSGMSLGLHEEEIADINLATFYVFDRED